MKCVYCNYEGPLTKSHIIPDVLSNGSMKNNNVCETHNSKFSDSFESYVSKNLAFFANILDIKSSKSNNYPAFTVIYNWNGKEFVDDRHTNLNVNLDKIIESTDGTSKIGPNYIVDKIQGNHNIESIIPNNKELNPTIVFNIDVFFSKEMQQLISKIAYEWFCSINKIKDKPLFGEEIRKFILDETTVGTVEVITDKNVMDAFKELGEENSHQLVTYLDKEKNYCVVINFWGIITYKATICELSEFPASIDFFYREQLINSEHLPYSKQNIQDLYSDTNIAIKNLYESEDVMLEKEICPDIKVRALNLSENVKDYHFKTKLSILMHILEDNRSNEEDLTLTAKKIDTNIKELISTNVIHPRKIKRVAQSLIIDNNGLNFKNLGNNQLPVIYFLYRLGKCGIGDLNKIDLTTFIKGCCEKHLVNGATISSTTFNDFFDEMYKDKDYIIYLKKGIELFK